jgi:hypothetical protein
MEWDNNGNALKDVNLDATKGVTDVVMLVTSFMT